MFRQSMTSAWRSVGAPGFSEWLGWTGLSGFFLYAFFRQLIVQLGKILCLECVDSVIGYWIDLFL